MICHAHRHPDKLNLKGSDTLPDVDIDKPEFRESELFDVFTGRARQQAIDWMKTDGRCWREHVQRLPEEQQEY